MRWAKRLVNKTNSMFEHGEEIALANLDVPVEFRRHPKARRLTLRINPSNRAAIITAPTFCSDHETIAFLERHKSWLTEQIQQLPTSIAFQEGALIPLRGEMKKLIFVNKSEGKGVVWQDPDEFNETPNLYISGGPEYAPRRLQKWLINQARQDLIERSNWHSIQLGLSFNKIMIKDQRSRWGSCSSRGVLSYSWRLILSPPFVLDYVAAHEVAHLAEMNHGPNFWKLVKKTLPDYEIAKQWLKDNGQELHRYGQDT